MRQQHDLRADGERTPSGLRSWAPRIQLLQVLVAQLDDICTRHHSIESLAVFGRRAHGFRPVTVVAQDPSELGARAALLLFARIDSEIAAPRRDVVRPRLITRGSGEIHPV